MKKILFLGGLTSGGAEHQMVVLATLLKDAGHEVAYLSDDGSDFYQHDLEEAGILLKKIENNKLVSKLKLGQLRQLLILRREIKKNHYDTVVSFIGHWNYLNCLLANKQSTQHRAITGIRNNYDEVFQSRRNKYYSRYDGHGYRKVSNSNAARIKYAKYYPKYADRLITIYNIVDLPPITSTYTPYRDNRLHILVPASYRSVKNPMGMLKAVSLLSDEDRKRLCIEWYGDIKKEQGCYDKMCDFIKQNNLQDTVLLYDATTDIANRINEADMVGLFSTAEGLPNAVCEGMMLGKPVLMTRVSDYEILAGGGNGFLCDANNVQSISAALSSAINTSKEELLAMGKCSKQKALSLFSKEEVLQQWEEII